MELIELLERGKSGDAILFCGAGYSAQCLGFEFDGTLGVGAHLLSALNEDLARKGHKGAYRQLPNAATKYKEVAGEHGLMDFLKDRFTLSSVTELMVNVIKFPWMRIYTTNYDNAIEIAASRIPKKLNSFNNTNEPPQPLPEQSVIHLHGAALHWNIHNFNSSCILDASSYAQLPSVSKWLEHLRVDLERASAVIFLGFSASDFHLNQVFFNASGLRQKAIFVNQQTSDIDPDTDTAQSIYGKSSYIGIEGLSAGISAALSSPNVPPLRLASFHSFAPARPSVTVPSVNSIQDLLTMGLTDRAQSARDLSSGTSSYHIRRDTLDWFEEQLTTGARIFLLSGEVCDGKSLVAEDLAQLLSASRPVFWLGAAYDDLLDEVARIVDRHPDAVLVVENCFELRTERLTLLARSFEGGEGLLILTARAIAADAETGKVKSLKPLPGFREHRLSSLSDREIAALESLIDQFGGFAYLGSMTRAERERYIREKCRRSLPTVLLDILRSEHVKSKYREQINRIDPRGSGAFQLLVGCLFLKHIGDPPPASFISEIFSSDVQGIIDRANSGNGSFHLLRVERGFVQTVPAIGASLILREFFEDADIVTTVVLMLERMAQRNLRYTEYERYAFAQLMRYSRLVTVVQDKSEIERFFDHVSKIGYFREEPLFWLQWHMAKAAAGSFVDAERLLDRGYAEAGNWEKRRGTPYNRKQLDDRRAKFLVLRADKTNRKSSELFRDFVSSSEIVERLLRDREITHHPFETLEQICHLYVSKGTSLESGQKELIAVRIAGLVTRAERRLPNVAEGYQSVSASKALSIAKTLYGGGQS